MTTEQFITKLQALKAEAVAARLYIEAACVRDAEARIIKFRQHEKLCQQCRIPSAGYLVPLWADSTR